VGPAASPAASPTVLCEAGARTMRDLGAVLSSVSADQYAAVSPAWGASMGQHVRHAVDHVAALLNGFEGDADQGGVIAYDRRERGSAIESDPAEASRVVRDLCERLEGLDEVQLACPLTIRVMVSGDGCEVELPTTLGRELAFVTHHMIHHLAMIKAICGELGLDSPSAFGRAPSTVRHETAAGQAGGGKG